MKRLLTICLFQSTVIFAIAQGRDSATDSTVWTMSAVNTGSSANYFNAVEKEVLLEINKLRTHPKLYATLYLTPLLDHFEGTLDVVRGLRTNEGRKAVEEAIEVLGTTVPINVLVPGEGLFKAAKRHTAAQSVTKDTGHTSPNGETMQERLKKLDYMNKGECISYGQQKARWIVIQLLVDDGVSSRGHRKILLNPVFKEVGIATGPHVTYSNMCTLDFGSSPLSFGQ